MIYWLIGLLVLIGAYFISVYNFFVSTKARIKAAIQEIGNQLKRQADLIPNLENSVKGYLKHEKGILEMLSEARKMIASGRDASAKIAEVLPKLTVAVEDNPELKANEVVKGLMDELRDTSDKVMYARRLLIDLTADFNVKRVTFPSSIVAGIFGFAEMKGLEVAESGAHLTVLPSESKTPRVNL